MSPVAAERLVRSSAASLSISAKAASRRASEADRTAHLGVGGLAALHDLQHDLFEVALPPLQRDDLGLEAGQVTRRGHGAGVEPLLVAVGAGADGVDVALGLDLIARQVARLGL
jgi:hypothetical protein